MKHLKFLIIHDMIYLFMIMLSICLLFVQHIEAILVTISLQREFFSKLNESHKLKIYLGFIYVRLDKDIRDLPYLFTLSLLYLCKVHIRDGTQFCVGYPIPR